MLPQAVQSKSSGPTMTSRPMAAPLQVLMMLMNLILLMATIEPATGTTMSTMSTISMTTTTATTTIASQCPLGCQCEAGTRSIVCMDAHLSAVPRLDHPSLLTTLEVIVKDNVNLTRLKSGTFANLRGLQKLSLSDNALQELEPGCFAGLQDLRELDLSRNRLHDFAWSAESTTGLVKLNLTRNYIGRLQANAFATLSMLSVLDLSGNRIATVEANAFHDLGSLLLLDLSDNLISELSHDTFDGLRSLQELRLQANRIRELTLSENQAALRNLHVLNVAFNRITDPVVISVSSLHSLNLRGNNITSLSTNDVPDLQFLDLSSNPIANFKRSRLAPSRRLQELVLSDLPELTDILDGDFADLPNLHLVNLSSNARLRHVSARAFRFCPNLAVVDLSRGNLQTLHGGLISSLTGLEQLDLAGNPWRCDCALSWLPTVTKSVRLMQPEQTRCVESNESVTQFRFGTDCTPAAVVHHSGLVSFRLGSTALLECGVSGDPLSTIKWVTPRHEVLHWYPSLMENMDLHPSFHDSRGVPVADESLVSRIQVLRNGNLFIGPVVRSDAGSYLCLAANSLGAQSVTIAMRLDYGIIRHVKVVSMLVGVATSIAFLLAALVARLVEMMLDRFGWCCCPGTATLPPRAKNIVKMLESIEHYKRQQLERLRDNYAMQVQRIKDNCNQQMERIRDSYSLQTDRFRDIRVYGTQQLNSVREQYYESIKRVRDYGVQQMSRVRENYVFQRNRVRKFQAHQLFKLRESYKVQQMHLNKILENMNLEICRTACGRADSIVFTAAEMMDTSSPSSSLSSSIGSGDAAVAGRRESRILAATADGHRGCAGGGDLLLTPFSFEMFDFAADPPPFPLIDDHDDDLDRHPVGSVPTTAFVTPPQSPIGSMLPQLSMADHSQSSNDSFVDFDDVVMCIVIPDSGVGPASSSAPAPAPGPGSASGDGSSSSTDVPGPSVVVV